MKACCECIIGFSNKYVRYITSNAYVYMAISGENFCKSSFNIFLVMVRTQSRFGTVRRVQKAFFLVLKMAISVVTTIIAFYLMQTRLV
jgi:hypothetical protein